MITRTTINGQRWIKVTFEIHCFIMTGGRGVIITGLTGADEAATHQPQSTAARGNHSAKVVRRSVQGAS